jgi:Nif-specific regulatory protein
LQEKEFERLGSTKTRRVDVRIIAATNKDLSEAVSDNTFREDLYYRLNVFPIQVPALRERVEDIPILINHFLEKISKEYGRKLRISAPAVDVLTRYEWPGNVREMENLIERLAIIVEGPEIEMKDFPLYLHASVKNLRSDVRESLSRLEEMEKKEIVAALERNNWIQSQAARELGLTLRQVGYRIKKFGLEALTERRRTRNLDIRARG